MPKSPLWLAASAVLAVAATAAQASSLGRPCTTVAPDKWLPIASLQSKIEALGYTVQKAKLKNACGEFYVTDRNGGRVELFVDPTNGDIVGRL